MSDDDPATKSEQTDSAVMLTLIGAYPALMTEAEVQREARASEIDVADALGRLVAAGLVHRHDRFLFATRAAYHASQLDS